MQVPRFGDEQNFLPGSKVGQATRGMGLLTDVTELGGRRWSQGSWCCPSVIWEPSHHQLAQVGGLPLSISGLWFTSHPMQK